MREFGYNNWMHECKRDAYTSGNHLKGKRTPSRLVPRANLQPLDDGVFGPLKRAYGKLIEGMMAAGNNHIDKEDFLHIYIPRRAHQSLLKIIYVMALQELVLNHLIKTECLKRLHFNFVHQHHYHLLKVVEKLHQFQWLRRNSWFGTRWLITLYRDMDY